MLVLVTASLVLGTLIAALLLWLRTLRMVSSKRSILLHVPIDRAWDLVSDFPALFAAHGRGRSQLRVTSSAIERGDGRSAGSVWVQGGAWRGGPYTARVEIVAIDAPSLLAIRLLGDSLGSERGLLHHRGELRLRAASERTTKVTWQLDARIRMLPGLVGRLIARERVEARLLDLSLRSLKAAIDGGTSSETSDAGDDPALALHAPLSPLATAGSKAIRTPQPR